MMSQADTDALLARIAASLTLLNIIYFAVEVKRDAALLRLPERAASYEESDQPIRYWIEEREDGWTLRRMFKDEVSSGQ